MAVEMFLRLSAKILGIKDGERREEENPAEKHSGVRRESRDESGNGAVERSLELEKSQDERSDDGLRESFKESWSKI